MNKDKKLSLRLGILAGLISIAMLGSTAGTLAWYAYSRAVTLSYVGTTVASSALLNVGLVDNDDIFQDAQLRSFNLERDDDSDPNNSIVWSKSREGFSLLALRHYLDNTDYATDELKPVTTGSRTYNDTDPFNLYRSPEFSETEFNTLAQLDNYVVLPFAFRVIDESGSPVAGKNVWLTDAAVEAEEDAESSVRVYFEGATDFLLQPSLDEDTEFGYTKVGGVLSIAPGNYFDFDVSENKEYCYGEFENDIQYVTLEDDEYEVLDNMNGVPSPGDEPTTFYAKHHQGVQVPNLELAVPKTQETAGMKKVRPSVDANGRFEVGENGNGLPVATTDATTKVGYSTATIFIEGWDYNVIDQKAGYQFNLNLKFEIDRV